MHPHQARIYTDLEWGCWQFVSLLVYRHACLSKSCQTVSVSGAPFTFLPAVKVHMQNLELLLQFACGVFGVYLLSRLVSRQLRVAASPDMAIAVTAGVPSAGNTTGILL